MNFSSRCIHDFLNDSLTTPVRPIRRTCDIHTTATHCMRQLTTPSRLDHDDGSDSFGKYLRFVKVVKVVNVVESRTKNNLHVNCLLRHISRPFTTLRFTTITRQMIRQTIRPNFRRVFDAFATKRNILRQKIVKS